MITFRTFLTVEEDKAYDKACFIARELAEQARRIVCFMVGGRIPGRGKEFVYTNQGVFRMAMSKRSDNSSESGVNMGLGSAYVDMNNDVQMVAFFELHDLPGVLSFSTFNTLLAERIKEILDEKYPQ